MVVAVYCRVSTDEQAKSGYSLPEQLRACRVKAAELAAAAGETLTVVEFRDDLSGDLLERPGVQAALELIRRQTVSHFICLDPDRLARKLMHQLLLADEIEERSHLVFVQHDYQADPEGQLFFQIRGAVAQFEKAKTLERFARGVRGKIAAGGLPHIIRLYGYEFRTGAGRALAEHVLVPDPIESEWVRTMYRWCADEGLGPLAIAKRLRELGVPTKLSGDWQHGQVRRILSHDVYATGRLALGKADHRGIAVARQMTPEERKRRGVKLSPKPKPADQWQYVEVEPIVPADLWQRAQGVKKGFLLGARANSNRIRMLTSIGRCGNCGGPLMYFSGRKVVCYNRYRPHYDSRADQSDCTMPAKSSGAVEAAVWGQVRAWILDPDLLRTAAAESSKDSAPSDNDEGAAEELAALEAQLTAKASEQERTGLLFTRGLWPSEKALSALDRLQSEIAALADRRAEIMAHMSGFEAPRTDNPILQLLDDPDWLAATRSTLDELTDGQRLELVRLLVGSYVMHETKRGEAPRVQVHPRSS